MMPLALALVGLELGILSWLVPKESEDDKLVIPAAEHASSSRDPCRGKIPVKRRRKIRILTRFSLPEEVTIQ